MYAAQHVMELAREDIAREDYGAPMNQPPTYAHMQSHWLIKAYAIVFVAFILGAAGIVIATL
jgi:hypothetical protein